MAIMAAVPRTRAGTAANTCEKCAMGEEPRQTGKAQKAAGAVASAVLAASLVDVLADPPHAELISLPEPVPIVQPYLVDDDDDSRQARTQEAARPGRLRRILRYLLVALALVLALVFGMAKGCVALMPAAPAHNEDQPAQSRVQDQTDERGVAL